jgi:hypothetical protein
VHANLGWWLDTFLVLSLLTWLIQGAAGPALVGLPVTWAATDMTSAARRWFRRLRRSDGLSRIVRAAAGDLELSNEEFAAVRRLLEREATWVEVGRGTVEDLAALIASCLPGRDGQGSLAAGRAIAGGLLEFAVRDLEPEWFRQVLFARLERLQTDQASALDQAMLSVHAGLAALFAVRDAADADRFAFVMGQLGRVFAGLPPGPADRGELEVYLATLISWLNADPWPQDTRFAGPELTPAAIERKLGITRHSGPGEEVLDADDLGRRCSRLVVLGGPGSGKTWLARRTARLCAEAALDALAAGAVPDEVELPLYTTCARLFAAPPNDGIRRAIVSSALGQLPDLGGSRVTDAVRVLFEERNAPTLLVADSLDEASGADDRVRQADTLPPSWRIVLTSRPASWNHQLAIGDDPTRWIGILQPLRYPDDVEALIAAWFSGRPAWARELVAQLRDRPALQHAATVPLILAFYCIVSGDQPLPARRAALYTKVIRRMLTGRWRGSGNHDPDPDACLETLRDWAWSAAASDPLSGIGTWPDEFPTPRVRRSQDDRAALDHLAPPLGPPNADTGMTQRSFVHRALREHLVAEHVARRMSAAEAACELLNHLWYDPDWEYAAPAALAMHPHRDQILREMIFGVTGGDQLPGDLSAIDGSWQVRRFLAQVAQESGEGDWSPETAQMIGRARWDLALLHRDDLQQVVAGEWPAATIAIVGAQIAMVAGGWRRYFREVREFAEVVARLAVTAEDRAQARQVLLALLADATDPSAAEWLAAAVAGVDPTSEDRAQARQVLLAMLADTTDPMSAEGLAARVTRLDPTAEDQAQARQVLLAMLADTTSPLAAHGLAAMVTRLDPTAEDQAQARQVLLAMLARTTLARTTTGSWIAQPLAATVTRLDPTVEDRAQARQALLALLARPPDPWIWSPAKDQQLAEAVTRLAVTMEDRAQARQALLTLLANTTVPSTALLLAATITGLDPTAEDRAQARQVLLTLLTRTTKLSAGGELAVAVTRLDPTAEDRTRARQALLTLLANTTNPAGADLLAAAVVRLDPAAEDQTRARQALLALLARTTDPWWASRELARAITRLAVTAQDRAQARQALLARLTHTTDPWAGPELAAALTRLEPAAEDRAQARQALLTLLARTTDPSAGRELAAALTRLEPAAEDRAQARQALLTLFTRTTDPSACGELAQAITRLAVTAEDRAQTRQALLTLLARMTDPSIARDMAGAVIRLAVTAEDRAQARQALLTLLADTTEPSIAPELAVAAAGLEPTLEDRAQARQVLFTLLANTTDASIARGLAMAAATLNPTVADLGSSDRWPIPPTPELLAAVRQNSELTAWLAALRSLSGSARTRGE